MLTLLLLAAVLRQNVACPACGFWYDDRYGHACTPC